MPNLQRWSNIFELYAVVSKDPVKAKNVGTNFNTKIITTDYKEIYENKDIDVFICTRHLDHAKLVINSLKNGKHVFVERPLSTDLDSLLKIKDFFKKDD
ncbi:MAG: Gfo/Idh/MocA family oxidoreductase, partial [Candidatus Omnitrophica bacterium]|nr:Gfo/Idh/MocA family oxidoreductase [Candidatus Omnitrophota bacterium]